jgi:hypothetical protein
VKARHNLGTSTSSSSLSFSPVGAKVDELVVDRDVRGEGSPVSFSHAELHSLSGLVPAVQGGAHLAKVLDPIVEAIVVDVVDVAFWPCAVVHRPSDAVGKDLHTINKDHPILIALRAAYPASFVSGPELGLVLVDQDGDAPGQVVVCEQFPQAFDCGILLHGCAPIAAVNEGASGGNPTPKT